MMNISKPPMELWHFDESGINNINKSNNENTFKKNKIQYNIKKKKKKKPLKEFLHFDQSDKYIYI